MKFLFKKGETSLIVAVFIQDSTSTTGGGLAGLTEASGITGGYMKRNGVGVALAVDENVTTEGTYQAPSTAGQVRIGTPANMIAGVYELHFHNDLFTTADYVTVSLGGASNMAPVLLEIQLTDFDLNTAIHEVNLKEILGTALTETAGQLAARFINFFDQDGAGFNIKTALSAFKADVSGLALAGEYDTEMGRITANVATEEKQDIIDTVVDSLLALNLADEWIDYSVSPARRHIVASGTSTPDLFVQELFTDAAASVPVTAVTDTIIRAVTV
jgi:hypothetical protein